MIPSENSHLTVAALSHPGEVREINEDRYSIIHFVRESDKRPVTLAMVADGIGGHQAGEVAAQIAVDMITEAVAESSGDDPVAQLSEAVIAAGRAISQASARDQSLLGMGSTVAIAMFVGNRLYTISVGDSRTYMVRDGSIQQISVDHTWVQEAINHGILTPEEARDHPNAHVLHRHLGGDKDPLPDPRLRLSKKESDADSESNQGLQLMVGDRLLLCSDGLTDLVEDAEILAVLLQTKPDVAVTNLVDMARARGGHDNITIVTVTVPQPEPEKSSGCLRFGVVLAVGGGLLLLLIAAGLAATYFLGLWPW